MDSDTRSSERPTDPEFDRVWREHRGYLVAIASRMLADSAAADDVVQEAFGRLLEVDQGEIDDVRAWLAVVVRRLCLNRIKSAYTRRESAAGVAPPETEGRSLRLPAFGPGDPADRISLDDQLRLALAIVVDRLTPAERTAFVLHDVFGFPFDAIAEIVGRTPAACRQLASRGRRTVRANAPSLDADAAPGKVIAPESAVGQLFDGVATHGEVRDHAAASIHGGVAGADTLAERFIAACAGGRIADLVAVLDPDVEGLSTFVGGGTVGHFEGAQLVATGAIARFGPGTGAVLVPLSVEGTPGIVVSTHGRIGAVIKLEVTDEGRIGHIRAFVLPSRPGPGDGRR